MPCLPITDFLINLNIFFAFLLQVSSYKVQQTNVMMAANNDMRGREY